MGIGNLSTGAAQLHEALDKLEMAWAETASYWHDSNSKNIEEKFLAPLIPEMRSTMNAIGKMSQVLRQAERELEDQ